MAVSAGLRASINERYPSLSFLLQDPEMASLLTQAVQQNWSPGQFQSHFIASKWFRRQSAPSRQWMVLAATDPTEAKRRMRLFETGLVNTARRLGIKPTGAEYRNLINLGLRSGLAPDDPYLINTLVNLARKGGRTDVGEWTTTAEGIRNLSKSEYFWNVPDHVNAKWTTWILTKQRTMEDYQAVLQREAMKRYPYMKEGLAGGLTVADQVRPLAEVYAQEMDQTADQIMATMRQHSGSPTRQLIGIRDPKTGKTRLPSEVEAMRLARAQPVWWTTTGGRQKDAAMALQLAKTFGRRA